MDEKKFSLLCSALQELNDTDALEDLQSIKEHVDAGTYFVAFIGQYSAGKSSLINNLLNRQILPGGRVETTPILTYILYGEEEGGRIFYLDGSTENIDLETVMNITQNNNSAVNLSEVEHLEILLNEKILADGMILLDTPGINTLIKRHEQLLANSLSLASSIIYVVNGAPTRVDIEKLKNFSAQGFPLSFVRTHCDQINPLEESFTQVVNADEKALASCDVMDALENRFFVSNIPESKYFSEIENIRSMLKKKGANAHVEIEKAAAARIEIICNRAIESLRELNATLGQKKNQRDETFETQRKKIDAEISKLRGVLKERQQRLKSEVENCQIELKQSLDRYAKESGDKAAKIIEAAGNDVKNNQDMAEYARAKIRPILNQTFEMISLQISPILKNINGTFKVDGDFQTSDSDAVIEDLPELSGYSEVVNFQDSELDKLRRSLATLKENRQQLQLQLENADSQELQDELLQLEQDLESLKAEQRGMGTYTPQMIQVDAGSNAGSQIGRTVGNILDLATLLIPAGTITKLATKPSLLKRIATLPVTAGKIVKGVIKGEKVTKTYATIKRMNQARNLVRVGAEYAVRAKDAGLLDYLSLEHWGEKLGSKFDSPPRYEEDTEYRQMYFEKKQQLQQSILKKQQELFKRKETLGAFKNETERKKAKLAMLDIDENELNRQLKAQENKLRKDAEKKTLQDWKKQWANYYREVLPKFLIEQANQYLADLPERLEAYQAHKFAAIEEKLSEKKSEYESLANLHEDDVANKFQRTEKILRDLESVK